MFGLLRLIRNPKEHGAEVFIEYLSKWLMPQIWPCIVPIWAMFTLVSAMMNLYKDSKFYSSYGQRVNSHQFFFLQRAARRMKDTINKSPDYSRQLAFKYVSKLALIALLATLSFATALSYHVTVMKLTQSMLFSVVLSTCVCFMSYAKFTGLYHKMRDLSINRRFSQSHPSYPMTTLFYYYSSFFY